MLSRATEVGDFVRSLVTTAEEKPFGLKVGNVYEVVGFPWNRNSGVVFVLDEQEAETPWSEFYFENVEE